MYLRNEPGGLRVVGIDREWPRRKLVDPRVVERPVRNRYAELDPERQKLFDGYAQTLNAKSGQSLTPEERFRALSPSEQTTFDGITHALMRSSLTDQEGRSLGRALDLVTGVERIAGQQAGRSGDQQFRLYVTLRPDARDTLDRSREFEPEPREHDLSRGLPALLPAGRERAEHPAVAVGGWPERGRRRRLSHEQSAAIALQRAPDLVEFGRACRR